MLSPEGVTIDFGKGVNKYVAKVVSMAVSTTINYLGIKTLVFRIYNKKEDQRDE